MPVMRATSSHIANGNQKPSQDDGQGVQQPCPPPHIFYDILRGVIDLNLASLIQVIWVLHENQQRTTQLLANLQAQHAVQDSTQPVNMARTSQPQEVQTRATDSIGGFVAQPSNAAAPTVVTANIDRALPNAFIHDPPYPKEILSRPYPKNYESPTFPQYDGRKGSGVKHVNKFLDVLGAHVDDKDLCLREFSKSLSDRAYTCEERITILDLYHTCQCVDEDLMVYVKRFRDLALDCYGSHVESFLVEICINNMFLEYHAILENIGISQFARLLNVAGKIAISVKAIFVRSL
ncbi:hypothetical protein SLEP1_g12528 [Rubroshorea leprosula]|uniref:Retrotransposon gag domain-containing protein n=1 Tax=Rubroshorea leprosula TaxID=152421 RepID=A0AAV5IHA5_9ROSI|nr:hypothetical protein SLEP1_g12528 [Rubroshorea leprosula]